MRIAFQNAPVHKRARVAFIGVAGQVFRRTLGIARPGDHFLAARKPAPPRPRSPDRITVSITSSGVISVRTFAERLVAIFGDVIFDIFGVDLAAVAQDDPHFLGFRCAQVLRRQLLQRSTRIS